MLLEKLSATGIITELSSEEKNLLQTLLANSSKLVGTGVAAETGDTAKGLGAGADGAATERADGAAAEKAGEAAERVAARVEAERVAAAAKADKATSKEALAARLQKEKENKGDNQQPQVQVQEPEGNSFNGGGIILAAIAAAVGVSLLL